MLESLLASSQTLKGYDLTKQKSPGYSRAVLRVRTSSMFTHYSVDKHVPFQCQSTAASEKFTRRRPLDAPSFSGWNLSYFSKHRPLRWDRLQTNVSYDVASAVEVINDLGLDTLTFLAVTVFIVPSFKLIKASPILGFFCAGVVLNQFGLIRNLEDVKVLSEWGILFLLFEMGLELSLARLKALAKYAFGMGLTQVLLSTLAFTAFELPPNGAVGTKILEFLFHSR